MTKLLCGGENFVLLCIHSELLQLLQYVRVLEQVEAVNTELELCSKPRTVVFQVIDAISAAISSTPGCSLLDVDPGPSTNRTVYTFVGSPEAVVEGALNAARQAFSLIDMSKHSGEQSAGSHLHVSHRRRLTCVLPVQVSTLAPEPWTSVPSSPSRASPWMTVSTVPTPSGRDWPTCCTCPVRRHFYRKLINK